MEVQQPVVMESRLYKIREVAEILGIPVSSCRELVASGQLRVRRLHPNGIQRVPGASLLEYLRGHNA